MPPSLRNVSAVVTVIYSSETGCPAFLLGFIPFLLEPDEAKIKWRLASIVSLNTRVLFHLTWEKGRKWILKRSLLCVKPCARLVSFWELSLLRKVLKSIKCLVIERSLAQGYSRVYFWHFGAGKILLRGTVPWFVGYLTYLTPLPLSANNSQTRY